MIERSYSAYSALVSKSRLNTYNAKVSESVEQFKEERKLGQRKLQGELSAKRRADRRKRAEILKENQLENEKTVLLR